MLNTLRSWWQDKLLRGVLKSSGYLFSSNTLTAAFGMLSSIFATRLLGVAGLGLVVTVQTFASNVNRLLSFRMSEVVVKYLGQALAEGESSATLVEPSSASTATTPRHSPAAAIVKGIGIVEALTSVVAFIVLVLLTPWAARVFAKEPAVAALFPFYGLMLLANLVYETSSGVIQTHKRFDRLALVNSIQAILTFILVLVFFLLKRGVVEVLGAYLVGKAFAGIALTVMAFDQMNHTAGRSWWRVPLSQVPGWRGILGFAINTNLNGTVSLVTRDNVLLYLAALSPANLAQEYVGYFKWGLAIINLVTLPIDPLIWPTYAETTRTIAQRRWQLTRSLLKRITAITGTWTLSVSVAIAIFGWWLIPLVLGPSTFPVYPVCLILLVGYGTANILNWNRPLLLAFGKPSFPLLVALGVGAVEVLLTLWLVPPGGYLVMAAILSGYLAISVGITAWRGWQELRTREALDLTPAEPPITDLTA